MPLNTEFPQWLQAQYAPQAQSPWIINAIQLATEREKMRQELPLQIQEMGLRNIQMGLANDTQRMVNEAHHIELNNFMDDQELLDSSVKQAAGTPGGAMSMPTPNFRSHQAMNLWLDRMKSDADTAAGIAYKQRVIEQTKRAQAVMGIPGTPTLRPGPDGTYDETQLQQAEQIATVYKAQQDEALARVKAMHDPVMFRAQRLGELQDQLDASQARVASFGKQASLQAGLGAAQAAGLPIPEPAATGVDVAEEARLQSRLTTEMEELRAAGTTAHSALTANDAVISQYERERDAALQSGDTKAAQTAQGHINYFMAQHRNPLLEAKLGSLRSEKAKLAEEMNASKPDTAKYKRLRARYDQLDSEMTKAVEEARGGLSLPASGAPTTNGWKDAGGGFKFRVKP